MTPFVELPDVGEISHQSTGLPIRDALHSPPPVVNVISFVPPSCENASPDLHSPVREILSGLGFTGGSSGVLSLPDEQALQHIPIAKYKTVIRYALKNFIIW